MNAILLPVKDLRKAKTRHADWLDRAGRVRLARAMLRDVAEAVSNCRTATKFLVSSDAWALEFARRRGWTAFVEPSQSCESASVDWASGKLAGLGFTHVLRLPADIPLVQAADLDGLLSPPIDSPGVLMVPSADGDGTNALLRSPPHLFPSRFGPGSFALHRAEAQKRGLEPRIVDNPRIALDLDDFSDLDRFWKSRGGGHTRRALTELTGRGSVSK